MLLKILMIEDEVKIADFVIPNLIKCGYSVEHVIDGKEGLATALKCDYDLMILDVMLPNIDGFTILKEIRKSKINIPVIVLTAHNDISNIVHGFEIGANDYLKKPFYVEELIVRIKACISKNNVFYNDEIEIGGLRINKINNRVSWMGKSIKLSPREFNLIAFMMRTPNYIFSRKQLLDSVWNVNFNPETNVVDVYIQRIRKRFELENNEAVLFPIETIRGVGYRFRLDS